MNETRMIYRPEGYPVSFEWHGRAYIDVYSMEDSTPDSKSSEGVFQRASAEGAPFAAIGVWDYGKGKPSIPVTREAFEAECDEWIKENREDYAL
ncbi:hypothetical protein [Micromonospora sp. CB01531]|uniref:hypothetical protein n=1 Tax=Micromonospora sp. CB01531 TaxID=1718947 RepID=UPI000B19D1CF|nr:hypothetical protein [Micromonospora sp. CB01531]